MNLTDPQFIKRDDQTGYHVSHACACGHVSHAEIEASDLFKWRQGAAPQIAFPYLTTTQNEALFMSGICGFCWNDLFGPDEDEDYEDTDIDSVIAYTLSTDSQDAHYEQFGRPAFPNEY